MNGRKKCGGCKYNVEERKIARRIYDLIDKQRRCFNRWHTLDLQIGILKHQLGGKYNG